MERDVLLDWMYGLRSRGIKLDLENTKEIMSELGNPQDHMKCIHVAGTDGKGSVCACIASILRASKIRTGLYTSPHLTEFNERISINGNDITDEELTALIEKVRPIITSMEEDGKKPTFFEMTTAMAFLHFKENDVEYAVIEVGMGGRLDSTNIIVPEVCVISNISMDHEEYLGDTIEKIASEKAGILKRNVPCVTMNANPAYMVISDVAKEKGAVLTRVVPEDIVVKEKRYDRTLFTFKEEEYEVSVPGGYQALNASLAIEAVSKLDIYGQLLRCNVREGLRSVRWPCRMEKVKDLPIILDVTHTLAGSKVLVESIGEMYDKVTLVFGLLDDKDIDGVSKNLSKIAKKVIVTSPDSDRALGKERVEEICRRYFDEVVISENVSDAMDIAMRIRGEDPVLVTGSFHMAGDAKKWLKRIYAGY